MAKKQATVDYAGSVSSGTLRTEDLAPAFIAELRRHWPEKATELEAAWDRGEGAWDVVGDEPEQVVSELIDALNEVAPEGYYFGAHWGDGADFGWWPGEDDGDDA